MLKFLLVKGASGGPLRFIGIIHDHLSKDTELKGFIGSYTWAAQTLHGSPIAVNVNPSESAGCCQRDRCVMLQKRRVYQNWSSR